MWRKKVYDGVAMAKLVERVAQSFSDVKLWGRNSKIFVATETLYGIPMQWVWFYQGIFMINLGMDEVLIGFTAMLPLLFQIFMPILGGHLADKYGRKPILIAFDTIAGIGALFVWLIATEVWQAILAVALQALSATILAVREAVQIEDTESSYRVSIYSLVTSVYLLGGILTPIAGALISLYGVIQGCRYVFLITLVSLMIMLITRQMYLTKSKLGSLFPSSNNEGLLRSEGYKETLEVVAEHRKLLTFFILVVIGNMQFPLVNTFRPLYLIDAKALALDEGIASIVPMASSVPSLIALSFLIPRLKHEHMRKALVFSYLCSILGLITLILAPKGSLILAVLSAVLDSARYMAFYSILRVFFVNTIYEINPLLIVKIMSLTTAFSAIASCPVPLVGGYLYAANPILPFVVTAIFLAVSVGLMLKA